MGLNLASILTDSAERVPDSPAIRLGAVELTYAQLDERSARLAALLGERGLAVGDRVGVMLPNVPEFPVAYYGVLRAGGVVVPMNVLLKEREIAFYLKDSGANLLLAWHGFAEEARAGAAAAGVELIEVEPEAFAALLAEHEPTPGLADSAEDDTAVILYTSGTTGKPKGAELTHVNLFRNAEVSSRTTCEIGDGDVVLGALPLFHSFGQTVAMNASLSVGACLTLVPKFDPGEALGTMQRDGVTHFYGVPTMYGALLHHPEREEFDTSTLRNCITGGASMPVEVLRGFEEAFGAVVLEGYGLSETSPVACSNHPDNERKPGSIGTPIEGVEMRVVDEDDNRGAPGRGRRDRDPRPQRHEGLLAASGRHRGGDARRLVPHRRHGPDRRRRLLLHRRPQEGHDHPRRLQRLPARGRGGALRAPGRSARRRSSASPTTTGRGGRRRRRRSTTGEELDARGGAAPTSRSGSPPTSTRAIVWFIDELPKGPTGKILKREIEVPQPDGATSANPG